VVLSTLPRTSSRSPRYANSGSGIASTSGLTWDLKETARLEAQAYELEQKVNVAHDMKTTLDSWVRWEGQVKQQQQKELADSVMATIEKELSNESTLKKILDQSVRDVERMLLIPVTTVYIRSQNLGILATKA